MGRQGVGAGGGGAPLVIITLEDSRSQSPEAADFNFN